MYLKKYLKLYSYYFYFINYFINTKKIIHTSFNSKLFSRYYFESI